MDNRRIHFHGGGIGHHHPTNRIERQRRINSRGFIQKWMRFAMSKRGLLYCGMIMAMLEVFYSFHTAVKYVGSLPDESQIGFDPPSPPKKKQQNITTDSKNHPNNGITKPTKDPVPPTSKQQKDENVANKQKKELNLVEYLPDGSPIGYLRIPQIPSGGNRTDDDGKLHIVFSSACNNFQNWQSELLLASAYLVGQRGRITRIVSGCNDKEAETVQHKHQTFPGGKNDLLVPIEQLNRSINDDFGLFVTPTFDGARDFPWINKPSSIKYFLEKARPELDRVGETIVVVLDPDFIFLKPLTQTGLTDGQYIATNGHDTDPGRNEEYIDVVKKGRPVAQRYGLGGGWTNSKKYNLQNITGESNPKAAKWTSRDAAKYTSVGPPLMLHIDDIAELSVLWERYMHPVLATGKDILADMWAYSIGAAQLDLKHTILDHYMISHPGERGEAAPWIDQWTQLSCHNPTPLKDDKFPNFIHMASNVKVPTNGTNYDDDTSVWMFHKGHVPGTILDCDTPLIVEAPDNLWDIAAGNNDRKLKRSAWMICHIVSKFNTVLRMYKEKFCPNGYEKQKLVRLSQNFQRCNQQKDKWCFPFAKIEGGLPSGN